jgi:lysophospholipase L1-like esterase
MQGSLLSVRGLRFCALALVGAALLVTANIPALAELFSKRAPNMSYYDVRRGLFGMSKIESAPIVMLGDSLTEAGPWTDLTGCLAIANRGIGGDTTTRVLDRLDEVLALRPRAIFLMIGVNDVSLGHPLETTLANLRMILDRLTGAGVQVFVSYVLPVTARYGKKRVNAEVPALNAALAKLIAERPGVTAIDARPLLRGADGTLREEFAYDGIHLTPKGYAVLRDLIAPHVAKYCTP